MKHIYTLPTGGAQYAPYLLEIIENNHTLIAGTTGAGKSVLENSIIYSIMSARFPGQTADGRGARLILIDPKKVELRLYKDLPHTLFYADNIDSIIDVLFTVRCIIDDRLKRMQRDGRRKSAECPIYVFIDELVDLITSARSKEIIRLISDSISIARACGVYFVILTQAPNRRILKPEIVLNCNCRVALRCNSPIESRQILGDDSAASLPLHGLGIVQKNLERYQVKIPFYTDGEIQRTLDTWTRQNKPRSFIQRIIQFFKYN